MNEISHGTKSEKIGERIRENVALFIEREASRDSLITVTRVFVEDNLKKATIFVTVMPESKKDEALAFLRRLRSDMLHFLKKSGSLPRPPFLDIIYDAGDKNRVRIEEISKEIENSK